MPASDRPSLAASLAAFGAGCLLTAMVHLNGELARYGNALFSSWVAHGTGAIAAALALALLRRHPLRRQGGETLPPWAFLGGLSGGATVILTSIAVNSPLALAGTLALGLVGQSVFSLAADKFGLFGLARRMPDPRDLLSLALIVAGSCLILWGVRP